MCRCGSGSWSSGTDGAWTKADDSRPGLVRTLLSTTPGKDELRWREPLAALAEQRLTPLESSLDAREDLPAVSHLIVLPSPALAAIPVEALLEARPEGAPQYLVSYAPSGTMFAWLEVRRRDDKGKPARDLAGCWLSAILAPPPKEMQEAPSPPDHGLLVQRVEPGSNADKAGIQTADVLIRYAGANLANRDDLQKRVRAVDPKATSVEAVVWREGKTLDLTLKPGLLGVGLETRPAAEAILAQRGRRLPSPHPRRFTLHAPARIP